MKNCPICGKGKLKKTTVTEVYDKDIVVEDIKVLKCSSCGEELTDSKEYDRIFKKVSAVKNAKTKIPLLARVVKQFLV
ncbi:MAG: YgiT-type zinc finger protein [Candidatus Micrarchaeota archaeon]